MRARARTLLIRGLTAGAAGLFGASYVPGDALAATNGFQGVTGAITIDAQRNAPGWIHYVDADGLQKIIDKRVIEQLKRFASLFFVGEPSERRKNVSIQDGQGNEKSAPGFGIADYPQR